MQPLRKMLFDCPLQAGSGTQNPFRQPAAAPSAIDSLTTTRQSRGGIAVCPASRLRGGCPALRRAERAQRQRSRTQRGAGRNEGNAGDSRGQPRARRRWGEGQLIRELNKFIITITVLYYRVVKYHFLCHIQETLRFTCFWLLLAAAPPISSDLYLL